MSSDPLKTKQFREVSRLRLACIERGECRATDPAVKAFDRLLVKVPEHTWGVAQSWFLPDYANWTNWAFDLARLQQSEGFVQNNTLHADYNTTVNSWLEQRAFVTAAPALLKESYPVVAAEMAEALERMGRVSAPETEGMVLVQDPEKTVFRCLDYVDIAFDDTGAVSRLDGVNGGASWANPNSPLGRLLYQTFTNEDYNIYMQDFAHRLGHDNYHPGSPDDMGR